MSRPAAARCHWSDIVHVGVVGLIVAVLTVPGPGVLALGPTGSETAPATGVPPVAHESAAAYLTNSSAWQAWRNFSAPLGSAIPPGRTGGAMAYDPALDGVVLFGGEQVFRIPVPPGLSRNVLGDTWLFTNGHWENLTLGQSPPDRSAASMAWDPVDDYLVLFGGYGLSGYYNDTWALENETWVRLGAALSPPYSQTPYSMAWDTADNYLVLFGGESVVEAGSPSSWMFNATWTFVGGNWTNRTTSAAGPSQGLADPQLTYDPAAHGVVMFGGRYYVLQGPPGLDYWTFQDANSTWEFSAGHWTNVSTVARPPGTDEGGMAYDAALNGVVLFGGELDAGLVPANDHTWLFQADNWTDVTANLTALPPTSIAPGLVDDVDGGFVLLFGGLNQTDYDLNATWVLGPPVVGGLTATPSTIDVGQTWTLNASAIASDGSLTYRYDGSVPGCTLGSVPVVACQPNQSGTFTVGVQVNDSDGYVADDSTTITVGTVPTVQSFTIEPAAITLGRTIKVNTTVHGGAPPVRFTFTGFPPGCPRTGNGNFTCQPTSAGSYDAQVDATDAAGVHAAASAMLVVRVPTTVTALTAGPSPLDVGQPLRVIDTVENGTPPYSYDYSGLPSNCTSVDAPTVRCNPTSVGLFDIRLVVTDAEGIAANRSVTIEVNPGPDIATWQASPSAFDLGNTTTLRATETGGTGVLTWTYQGLPPGCTPENSSTLLCRPVAPGDWSVTVTATDTVEVSASASVSLVIAAPLVVIGIAVTPRAIDADQPLELGATVTGGTSPLTYAYTGLPPACVVLSIENVTCQPPSGQYEIGLTVRDAVGVTQSVRSLLAVYTSAAVDLSGPGAAAVGATVGFAASAVGGAPPYTFAFSGLPSGCTDPRDANVTCVLGASGTYLVTVEVTDAAGERASARADLTVTTAVAPSTTAAELGGIGGLVAAGILLAVVLVRRHRRRGARDARAVTLRSTSPADDGAGPTPGP